LEVQLPSLVPFDLSTCAVFLYANQAELMDLEFSLFHVKNLVQLMNRVRIILPQPAVILVIRKSLTVSNLPFDHDLLFDGCEA
jgi:hypothetical protein